MVVAALRAELLIPGARSLKAKRRPLKSLIQHIRNRFHCSVSEVDFHDLHQRTAIGVAVVGPDGRQAAELIQAVREFIQRNPELQVIGITEESFSLKP